MPPDADDDRVIPEAEYQEAFGDGLPTHAEVEQMYAELTGGDDLPF